MRFMRNGIRLMMVALIAGVVPVMAADVDLSPEKWADGDFEYYSRLNDQFGLQNVLAEGSNGVVTGTTSAAAQRAGLEALIQGGSAVDAVLTTSLAQIALAMGSWVSYGGIFTMVYYDAETGAIHNLNGGYNTILGEDDPMSIPGAAARTDDGRQQPSGRTALVPGYMAAVQAAHDRFGKLPFAAVFGPALYYAEEGFELNDFHTRLIEYRKPVLSRLPATKAVFTKPDGSWYAKGDLFTQPELAGTLRAVAEIGASYMYTGPWAERLVAAVQADGGKMTMEDMRSFEATWTEPMKISYGGYEIHAHGLPAQGGVHIAEALNVASLAKIAEMGHYSESTEAFFWVSQITNLFGLSFLPEQTLSALLGGADGTLAARTTMEHAERVWKMMSSGTMPMAKAPSKADPKHSDAVIAIDQWGNIAAIVHTINTGAWGDTGIFVDGVSIPDSASSQQLLISQVGPGVRLPDPTEPLIMTKDGTPVAALSSIGSGLHQKTVATLMNFIDFEMGIKEAVDEPSWHLPEFSAAGLGAQQVFEGDFCNHLLEGVRGMGLGVNEIGKDMASRAPRGYVIGASIDADGVKRAVATDTVNGRAVAY
jgi:gamma-glutamyltranspeptidase/glutathione hydrolase